MCQHALCEHKRGEPLLPQPPSWISTILGWTALLIPLTAVSWLVTSGSRFIPLAYTFTGAIGLILLLVLRSLTYPTRQLSSSEKVALQSVSHSKWVDQSSRRDQTQRHAQHLSEAIRIKSISMDKNDIAHGEKETTADEKVFLQLHALFAKNYPLVHKHLEKTVVNEYSLLFHWKGSDSSQKPIMLAGHMDVVPVLDQHLWDHDAFGGEIIDGFIHGRGAIDDKQAVCGILGAVEDLIASGYTQPKRDIYLAFGHDEEIGGWQGAAKIAEVLKQKKVKIEFMLDEGLFVMHGILPGLKEQVALVCVAEKGYLANELKVSVPASLAGHASAPSSQSAIGILSRALLRMEANPMPSYLLRGSPVRLMFESLAPHFSGPIKLLFTNLWLFAPLLKFILTRKPTTATMVRTTTALTVMRAGAKENVVPREAVALINHRIHPRDTVEGVIEYTKRVVDDERIKVRGVSSIPPAPVSSSTSFGFKTIQRALGRALPDVLVAPALMVGNTDTHHYWGIADDIYRFSPTRLTNETVGMFHGANEKMNIDNFIETIGFYRAVIQLADGV